MVKRLLYWLTFKIDGIPELNRLPYQERIRVITDAQQAGWRDGMSDLRCAYWAVAYINVMFVAGFLFFTDRWVLGLLLLGGMMGWALYLARAGKKMMRQGVLRALDEHAKAAAKS